MLRLVLGLRISSFLNICLYYIPCNFQLYAFTHSPIIFRPGPWLPGALLGLNPQAQLSEASSREDALAQSEHHTHWAGLVQPSFLVGGGRGSGGVIRGAVSMSLRSPPQGCSGFRRPFSPLNPSLQRKLNLQVAPNVYSQIDPRVLLAFREEGRMAEVKSLSVCED